MTPPLDLYDRILDELEGVHFEDQDAAYYPSDEDVRWNSETDEEGWAA